MQHIVTLLSQQAQQQAQQVALKIWRNQAWQCFTWTDFSQQWTLVAKGLVRLGHQPQQRVAIMSPNMPEWTIADLGILAARGCVVPIYPTNTLEQSQYILKDADCKILFVGQAEQVEIGLELLAAGHVETLICFEDSEHTKQQNVLSWKQILTLGESANDTELSERQKQLQMDDLATLIYTSGTTGEPKGVMLDHRNFAAAFAMHDQRLAVNSDDVSLSFLPLSHVFERAWTYYILYRGATNIYLEDPATIQQALPRSQPTLMCSVPRLYEKIHSAILQKVSAAPAVKQTLFNWAMSVAQQRLNAKQQQQTPSIWLKLRYALANKLVLAKIRAVFGPARLLPCSGARLADDINSFFQCLDVPINYGYGMTESTATVSCYSETQKAISTIGQPLEALQIKISDKGEILVKGDTVMRGYFNKPQATAETIVDGWLHTGDAGNIDAQGNLVLTERIKELMKTSGGKYIAPQRVEGALIREPLFEQVAIIADARHFVSALIVPAFEALELHAKQLGIKWQHRNELLENAEIKQLIQARLKQVQTNLARFEQVKQFTLLPREFCMKQGELTPTLKLRRAVIESRFAEQISAMYAETRTA
ncbi:long-chain fatty acid--CoA ligase [Agarivorans sp. TSD2052]|uniref:AMP-dependent synthetase/ligase n=1 Tax=Agarivorans sp. TSD2052 TaxID=2937286 RepID=UPI00200FE9E4|nr:long-chain fatty acid--CoA ligase [Agarivorans sp. TSD2052]UPW20102.1 long-chain fatty acid--CoA ligase [Agarivorans sp. TSD2052]